MKHIIIALIATLILASCAVDTIDEPNGPERTTLYFVDIPCEEGPEWYPGIGEGVQSVIEHLASEGIEADVELIDRGAVCMACIEDCAPSYLIAEVSEDDVASMLALGWRTTLPFSTEMDSLDLIGSWQLIEAQVPEGRVQEATLNIDSESIGGQSPCNAYGGSVTFGDGAIEMSGIFQTLMACMEGDLMEQEAAYLSALRAVETYRFENGVLVLSGAEVELRFERMGPNGSQTTVYFVDIPCEQGPEWYPDSTDTSSARAFLESRGIDAQVRYNDRGAVCRACMEACAGSYLEADISAEDVDAAVALGWRVEHPFPDESDDNGPVGTEFSYTPMQCERTEWSSTSFATEIAERYAEYDIVVSQITRHELDIMTCEACYVCPTNIEYRLILEQGSPDPLVRDGWVGGPSCEQTGCSEGRTCSGRVCVYDGLAVE